MYKLLLIAIGGALGTLARYGTTSALQPISSRFPWGTLAVNLLGCFVIGLLQGVAERGLLAPQYRVPMLVGFLGGYTTFSTFGWETASFLQDGQFVRAGLNVLGNNVIGVVLVMLGYIVGARP